MPQGGFFVRKCSLSTLNVHPAFPIASIYLPFSFFVVNVPVMGARDIENSDPLENRTYCHGA